MANKRTSEEVDGGTFQKNDLTRIARNGNNYKLTAEQVFSEELTLTDFYNKSGNGELIAGRTYKVLGFRDGTNSYLITKALDNYNLDLKWFYFYDDYSSPVGYGFGSIDDIEGQLNNVTDFYGNYFLNPNQGSTLPNYSIYGNFFGCYFDGTNGELSITNWQSSNFSDTDFKGGTYSLINASGKKNIFTNSSISNFSDVPVEFYNLNLNNSSITFDGSNNISISNCHFENCNLTITNGANIDGLTIIGSRTDEDIPTYVIDGTYQNKVFQNWAGYVLADKNGGYSTVRALLEFDNAGSGTQGTYDNTKNAYLIDTSPVGIYEIGEFTIDAGATTILEFFVGANAHLFHKLKFKLNANLNVNTFKVNMKTSIGALTGNNQVMSYHGITAKVGELKSLEDWIEIRARYTPEIVENVWYIEYGVHYDL